MLPNITEALIINKDVGTNILEAIGKRMIKIKGAYSLCLFISVIMLCKYPHLFNNNKMITNTVSGKVSFNNFLYELSLLIFKE